MDKIRLMIVDDHPIVREGLETMFSIRPRFTVVATAAGGEEAVEWCKRNGGAPDVILSDVRMPGMDGFAMLAKLKRLFPDIKVLFLAGLPNKTEEAEARQAGAAGYVSKGTDTNALADAVARIAGGEEDFVTDRFKSVRSPLSERERETLEYFAAGKTREEIAIIMSCSPETVKTRSALIRQKLDVVNTAAAISRAYELGILRI